MSHSIRVQSNEKLESGINRRLRNADGPIIRSVGPAVNAQLTVSLYDSTAKLECHAEANPPPSYQWLHRTVQDDGQESIVVASNERVFHFTNVTYEVQVCLVLNMLRAPSTGTWFQQFPYCRW